MRVAPLACVLPFLVAAFPAGQASKPLPPGIDGYVTRHVKLTPAQRSQLAGGQPVTKILATDLAHEVAVFGAVWVNAPIAKYVAAAKDIEQFEKGENFLVTKKIGTPPRLDDFAQLRLPPDDLADLRTCKVGSCEIKLSEGTLLRLRREVDWSKPAAGAQVEALARQLALDYANG
jgi:hypothetical protein